MPKHTSGHKRDMQPVGVQDHFSQNVLKFGLGMEKCIYEKGGQFGFVDGKFFVRLKR